MAKNKHLGSITILVNDRQKNSCALNKLLSDNSANILGRMGLNITPKCSSDCFGLITLSVEGEAKEIRELAKKINSLYGIQAKSVIITR